MFPTRTLTRRQLTTGATSYGVDKTGHTVLRSSTMLMTIIVSVVTLFLTFIGLVIVFTAEDGEESTTPMTWPAPNIPVNKAPEVAHGDSHDVTDGAHDVTDDAYDVTYDAHSVAADAQDVTHDDGDNDGGNDDTNLYAGLTCVTSERAATDTVDYVQLYQPCDNIIYSVGSACGNVGPKASLQMIAALEDKAKYVGFDYDGSQDVACYASLGRIDGWENNGFAALSVVLANDFSDVADVASKVKLPDKLVRYRTKYGVAVFNLDYYYLDQYPECPPLNLRAFKLPRPGQQ